MKRVTGAWRTAIVDYSPPWLRRSLGPSANYLDMLLFDHGIFRFVYLNKHRLSKNAWRSAQPAPHQLRRLARKGLKTVVNLRGARSCGSYWLEKEACDSLGLKLVNLTVRSRAAPSRAEIAATVAALGTIEYPALLHCKSGADRAGLVSVLYLHLFEGVPIEKAVNALSLRYGHIRQADTGVLDYFFERYLEDNARSPVPFLTWVETVYDAEEVKRSFHSQGWANRLVDKVLKRE